MRQGENRSCTIRQRPALAWSGSRYHRPFPALGGYDAGGRKAERGMNQRPLSRLYSFNPPMLLTGFLLFLFGYLLESLPSLLPINQRTLFLYRGNGG